ncbi:hypothetical protein R3P38DRAFT_2812312 [Favolaschia claudopus]|uniref:Uncharacterized protein n=1 Tax=Favolaschia claudopus TaxID=2862362 RepID=A0AAV9Z6Y5_9AGAR
MASQPAQNEHHDELIQDLFDGDEPEPAASVKFALYHAPSGAALATAPPPIPSITPATLPITRQSLLPGASQPVGGSKGKKGDRCALCVASYCLRRHECPGRGNRSLCRCGHPPLKTQRARITEAMILKHWAKKAQESL